jgi:PAS domain S-box-containing protein
LEPLLEEGRCSILTLDTSQRTLQRGAGPNLPEAYMKAIEGVPIGPEAGSCGTAMWHRRPVVAEDIDRDPLWREYKAAALLHGLRACASVPILDRQTEAIGAFAIYHDHPGPFSPQDMALLERFAGVASLAIQGHLRERRLADSKARYHALVAQSPDAIFLFDPESKAILESNAAFCDLMGYSPEELKGLRLYDLVAHDRSSVDENVRRTLAEGQRSLGERLYRRKDGSLIRMEVSAAIVDLGGRPMFSVIARDATERYAAQEALRLSEARLSEAQRLGGLGHWSFDLATGRIEWSEEIYRIFRRDPSLGPPDLDTYLAYFGPEQREEQRARIQRAVDTAEQQDIDLPISWPDGSVTWHRGLIHPESEGGRVVRLVGIAHDITARKRAEEALAASVNRFRDLFEASPVPLAMTRVSDGVVLMANQSTMRLFGTDERVIGTPFGAKAYLDPEDRGRFLAALKAEGSLQDYEVGMRTRHGPSRLLVSARLVPWEGQDAILLGYTDITERRRQEEALRKSEATFRHLFDTTPAALVLSRPSDGTILLANPAAYRMFELTPEEVVHHRTVEFFADLGSRYRLLKALRDQGRAEDFELEMRVHGALRRVLLQAVILHYQGEPAIMVALTDITVRQREEEALRQAQKLESLGVLAGGIAHDFNNLLTAILGNLNLAQLHLRDEDAAMPYLANMEAVVHRAADLARQMLAYSGRGRFRFERVDLNRMVREMTQLLAVGVSKKVQLLLDLEPGLPGVEGDPIQLQQVIMNLVTNASEAIGDREGTIRVHTSLRHLEAAELRILRLGQELPAGDYLCLEVGDSGVGMTAETLARLFDPFFTTKATGRGLGLSAMLGILRGHRAGLGIQSALGEGSTFRLYFTPAGPVEPADEDSQSGGQERMAGRILVVDDEAPVRQSAAGLLRHLGFEVVEAEDGAAGVDLVRADPAAWSCVILDLTMPRMDGSEALRHLRALRPDLPVILSSGFSDQATALPLDRPGTFLPKPYRMDELRAALQSALGS